MGGSSSSSTSQQQVRNETLQADAQGNLAPVFQGQNVQYEQNFSPEVAGQFSNLVDLAAEGNQSIVNTFDKLLNLASASLLQVSDVGETAIQAIAERRTEQENPDLATINKLIPLVLIGMAGLVALTVFKGSR